jgi:hypothetical protein
MGYLSFSFSNGWVSMCIVSYFGKKYKPEIRFYAWRRCVGGTVTEDVFPDPEASARREKAAALFSSCRQYGTIRGRNGTDDRHLFRQRKECFV